MNIENSKTNQIHKFVFDLSHRLDLRSSNKHVALQNLSINYTWKNIRQHYKNNKLKETTATWNDEFELPEWFLFSVRYSILHQVYYTKHEKLTNNPPIHIDINSINDILVFKSKTWI